MGEGLPRKDILGEGAERPGGPVQLWDYAGQDAAYKAIFGVDPSPAMRGEEAERPPVIAVYPDTDQVPFVGEAS